MKVEKGKAYRALFDNGICKKNEVVVVKEFKSDYLGMDIVFEGKEKVCPIGAFANIFKKL